VIQTDAVARDAGDNGRQNPLLLLPAVGDNAAMHNEPLKADPPKRRRRWFQFSLHSLTIFTTVAQLRWVALRRPAASGILLLNPDKMTATS
jgi:hypothetical protein